MEVNLDGMGGMEMKSVETDEDVCNFCLRALHRCLNR